MKAIDNINPPDTGRVLIKQKRIDNHNYSWLRQICKAICLAIFLLMIVVPADASTGPGKDNSGKNRRTTCRSRRTSVSYPVIIKKNKKSPAYKKGHKLSGKRSYSFPV